MANPSPAQMRNLSLIILDKGISRKEEELFQLFFGTKENESLKKSIENCNVDKFRQVISFLKDETDSENSIRIEMSALLVDFKPRPYTVFSNTDDLELVVTTSENQVMSNVFKEIDFGASSSNFTKSDVIKSNNSIPKKKIGAGLFSLLGDLTNQAEEIGIALSSASLNLQAQPVVNSENRNLRKKISILILAVVCVFLVGYTSKTFFFSNDCMQ